MAELTRGHAPLVDLFQAFVLRLNAGERKRMSQRLVQLLDDDPAAPAAAAPVPGMREFSHAETMELELWAVDDAFRLRRRLLEHALTATQAAGLLNVRS